MNRFILAICWSGICLAGCWPGATLWAADAAKSADELVSQARAAFQRGDRKDAASLLTKAIELDPNKSQAYYFRGRVHEALREHDEAIADYSQVLKIEPRAAQVYQLRGSEHFRAGNIDRSISDFDRFIELAPAQAPQHWQRGISYYYAGRYEDGQKQFESHQTVNSNDVENAVWHFLCVARGAGVEKARAGLIPIQSDGRIPMMEIFALFGGQGTVENVLAAARAGTPSDAELKQRMFYAHLYLGLYFEATGAAKESAEHIAQAAGPYLVDHYMGDVARVHAKLRPASKP